MWAHTGEHTRAEFAWYCRANTGWVQTAQSRSLVPERIMLLHITVACACVQYKKVRNIQGMTPEGQITVRLPPAQLKEIDAIVSRKKKTEPFVNRTDVVRTLIAEALAAAKKSGRT